MLMHYFSLSIVLIDVIQLLSVSNEGGTRSLVADAAPQRSPRELADSLKKWLPSGGMKQGLSSNRKQGKNDKLLPLSAILDDSKAEPRKKRKISSELLEIQKEIENAVGEQAENYPDPSPGYPVPDAAEVVPDVSSFEELLENAEKVKANLT